MQSVRRLSEERLLELLEQAQAECDDDLCDAIYDEFEARRGDEREPIDLDEQDRRAAAEERYELWRREY